jgi:hypothetical protein
VNFNDIAAKLGAVLDKARDLLKGEPARAIGYGTAAVIYLVAMAFDRIPDMSPEEALTSATFAITSIVGVIESIRHFVYSPATVSEIVEELATAEPETDPSGDVPFEDDPLDDEEPSA